MLTRIASVAAALTALPAVALACGGLFCDNAQPVNQAAERILFARDAGKIEMHVQIAYQGPPANFGWLLPTAPDVETTLGSEELFRVLDQDYAPQFQLNFVLDESCSDLFGSRAGSDASASAGDDGAGGTAGDGGVQVLSREALGPYDRTILQANSVQDLRNWLDANGYQIPASTDEKLAPYVDAGAAFVALKMLPGADAGDVQPLRLVYTAALPAIPITPTGVAANPDMGVLVHVLGQTRAIPKNYRHLQINEAALDWTTGGQNYADVVSQAADEAAGRGFVTDFAGPHDNLAAQVAPLSDLMVDDLAAAQTLDAALQAVGYNLQDADLVRIFTAVVEPPEGISAAQFLSCPSCFDEQGSPPLDGAALAARVRDEINPPRERLATLLGAQPYLTRLYTTLSPAEMDLDPEFSFNPDLAGVDRLRTATQITFCEEQGDDIEQWSVIELSNGLRFPLDTFGSVPDAIARRDGESLRGADAPAAAVIEQLGEAGQPTVIEDRTDALAARYSANIRTPRGGGGVGGTGDGCGCRATGTRGGTPWWLALPWLPLALRRRRR